MYQVGINKGINTTISQAADESLGKYKAFAQNKKLGTRNDEIKLIVQQKQLSYELSFE